ncbi:MAG: SagB/ThcOx family dehydrogenase [Candidatus Omnitrophica bacterium]|nr:SagB/ThcOx family dehydrogenase [Candidatus Omnitrophota bacterium]MCM8828304.1 SagB/ThcOx family dehydrogenase [Candidatus Omnitrophota bacterium]
MEKFIQLPQPSLDSRVSLEQAIYKRRSVRSYRKIPLEIEEISQILWAACGKNAYGKRTVPSAGATYPFDIYLVAGDVKGIESGTYLYDGRNHSLKHVASGDIREKIAQASYGQKFISEAPASLVLVAQFQRTTSFYGKRGERYVYLDAGHIGQNVSLQVEALGLGTCIIGAFDDHMVAEVLGVKGDVVYIMPVGRI